ncbi:MULTISPECIES: hypothetical protein [Pedobacter]|uniref:hypothetical protein n=1 Tax=Pedobacter TaxID=84567 RepID=UPI00210DADDC|nr:MULTISPECIES: hypothetical protein [unclassified Pedobacter]
MNKFAQDPPEKNEPKRDPEVITDPSLTAETDELPTGEVSEDKDNEADELHVGDLNTAPAEDTGLNHDADDDLSLNKSKDI